MSGAFRRLRPDDGSACGRSSRFRWTLCKAATDVLYRYPRGRAGSRAGSVAFRLGPGGYQGANGGITLGASARVSLDNRAPAEDGGAGRQSNRPPIAHDVKIDRGGEQQGVDTVEDAPMAWNERAPVFCAPVTLDRRQNETPEEAHCRDKERYQQCLEPGKRGEPREKDADGTGGGHAAHQSFNCF